MQPQREIQKSLNREHIVMGYHGVLIKDGEYKITMKIIETLVDDETNFKTVKQGLGEYSEVVKSNEQKEIDDAGKKIEQTALKAMKKRTAPEVEQIFKEIINENLTSEIFNVQALEIIKKRCESKQPIILFSGTYETEVNAVLGKMKDFNILTDEEIKNITVIGKKVDWNNNEVLSSDFDLDKSPLRKYNITEAYINNLYTANRVVDAVKPNGKINLIKNKVSKTEEHRANFNNPNKVTLELTDWSEQPDNKPKLKQFTN